MADTAAHLVDRVLPRVPVRQWVLSVPRDGFGLSAGQCGGVTFVQRFGSALNLNVHFHMLALDGLYVEGAGGGPEFHQLPAPEDAEVVRLAALVAVSLLAAHAGTAGIVNGANGVRRYRPVVDFDFIDQALKRHLIG